VVGYGERQRIRCDDTSARQRRTPLEVFNVSLNSEHDIAKLFIVTNLTATGEPAISASRTRSER
jgi:hypothetical protein